MRFEYTLRLDQIGTEADSPVDLAEEFETLGAKIKAWTFWTDVEMELVTDHKGRLIAYTFYTEDPTICDEFPNDFEIVGSLFENEDMVSDLSTVSEDWFFDE